MFLWRYLQNIGKNELHHLHHLFSSLKNKKYLRPCIWRMNTSSSQTGPSTICSQACCCKRSGLPTKPDGRAHRRTSAERAERSRISRRSSPSHLQLAVASTPVVWYTEAQIATHALPHENRSLRPPLPLEEHKHRSSAPHTMHQDTTLPHNTRTFKKKDQSFPPAYTAASQPHHQHSFACPLFTRKFWLAHRRHDHKNTNKPHLKPKHLRDPSRKTSACHFILVSSCGKASIATHDKNTSGATSVSHCSSLYKKPSTMHSTSSNVLSKSKTLPLNTTEVHIHRGSRRWRSIPVWKDKRLFSQLLLNCVEFFKCFLIFFLF